MSPNSALTYGERDDAVGWGRPKSGGGTVYYVCPGGSWESFLAFSPSVNTDYYYPFSLTSGILVESIVSELATGTAGQNYRMGLYRSDGDWQPIGAPLLDSGNIATDSSGVKTYSPTNPLLLRRGRYMGVLNTSSGAIQWRAGQGAGVTWTGLEPTMGANPAVSVYSVGRTYAAFPTPGTKWTTTSTAGYGVRYAFFLKIQTP